MIFTIRSVNLNYTLVSEIAKTFKVHGATIYRLIEAAQQAV